MRDRNTMGLACYTWENAWWFFISMVLYRRTCFRPLPGSSAGQSAGVLWAIAVLFLAAGFLMTCRRRRNYLSMVVTLCIPFGIYSLIACWPALRVPFFAVAAIAALATGVYLYLLMGDVRTGKRFVRRFVWFLQGTRTICALGLLTLVTALTVSGLFEHPLLRASAKPEVLEAERVLTVADHAAELSPLVDGTWDSLDTKDKLNVLQVLANIEGGRLGLGHELNVGCDVLGETTAASYRDKDRLILVDLAHLDDDPYEIVDSLCHEAHHAQAHRLAELAMAAPESARSLPVVRRGQQYAREFARYQDSDADYDAYYEQSVEEDARSHGEAAAETYLYEISVYVPESPAAGS